MGTRGQECMLESAEAFRKTCLDNRSASAVSPVRNSDSELLAEVHSHSEAAGRAEELWVAYMPGMGLSFSCIVAAFSH